MSDLYYATPDGQAAGPVSLDALRRLRDAGQIDDLTPVIPVGAQTWGTYAEYAGTVAAPPRTPTPAPYTPAAYTSAPTQPVASTAPGTRASSAYDAPAEPGLLLRVAGNPVLYVGAYLLFMIPTYVLPYMGSNSHILRNAGQAINRDMGNAAGAAALNVPFYLHLILLGLLVVLGFVRGHRIGKRWLVLFPALALAFDMLPVLTLIPLVPTAMHLAAIIAGVVGTERAAVPARA